MIRSARRSVPLLLAGTVALALALVACATPQGALGGTPRASAPPAKPLAQTSPLPALAGTVAAIPGVAKQVTLSMDYGMDANSRKPPAPVTITGSGKVNEIARLVADQPPWPPGSYSCPADYGVALILTFRAHPGGPALAAATLQLSGCGGTRLTMGTKDYVLGSPDSARPLAIKVLAVADVPWKLAPLQ
jgi:hypothetical protein